MVVGVGQKDQAPLTAAQASIFCQEARARIILASSSSTPSSSTAASSGGNGGLSAQGLGLSIQLGEKSALRDALLV
jgi:hypothetical protein